MDNDDWIVLYVSASRMFISNRNDQWWLVNVFHCRPSDDDDDDDTYTAIQISVFDLI